MEISGNSMFMTRGDSETISVRIEGYTMQPGDFLDFTVRARIGAPVVLHKRITDFVDGTAYITIEPKDTSLLPFAVYVYDVQLTYGGSVKTVIKPSKFTIGEEVTYGN